MLLPPDGECAALKPRDADQAQGSKNSHSGPQLHQMVMGGKQNRPLKRKAGAGVYFLLLNSEIVYIGSSANMKARIKDHRTNGRPFDWAFLFETKEREFLETMLIKAIRPVQNRAGKGNGSDGESSKDIRTGGIELLAYWLLLSDGKSTTIESFRPQLDEIVSELECRLGDLLNRQQELPLLSDNPWDAVFFNTGRATRHERYRARNRVEKAFCESGNGGGEGMKMARETEETKPRETSSRDEVFVPPAKPPPRNKISGWRAAARRRSKRPVSLAPVGAGKSAAERD
jgi:hypothetical protein